MATLTVQTASLAGAVPTFVAAAGGGDELPNTGRQIFYVKNGDGSPHDVTINSVATCDQGFDHNVTVTVAAGVEKIIGPFPTARWNDTGTGRVAVTYSAVTSVTVAAVRAY